ncbi:VCBS repeat-containing protein [Patescibacteria group bacterium]|nr:VCBS repeat-containing protein [Patescibacteria group bacterium]
MKRILSLSTFICVLSSLLFAEQWSQTTLGDLYSGTCDQVTFSELPGTRYIKNQKASIKLSSKGPVFKRTNWDPPPKEAKGSGGLEFSDLDNDGDYDLLRIGYEQRIGTANQVYFISITENIGTRFEPLFKFKGTVSIPQSVSKGNTNLTAGDIDKDGIPDIMVSVGGADTHKFIAYKGLGNFVFERKPEGDILAPCWMYWMVPELGDLNNDGYADLIAGSPDFATSSLIAFLAWENNKGKGFIRREEWDPGSVGSDWFGGIFLTVELVDLDKDGDLDLYYDYTMWGCISSYENIGGLSSPLWKRGGSVIGIPTQPSRTPYMAHNMAFADMNGDGYEELFVNGFNVIFCWENTKEYEDVLVDNRYCHSYIFKAKEDPIFPGYHGMADICCADLDNDGKYDEIFADYCCMGSFLVFWKNTSSSPDNPYFFDTLDKSFYPGIFHFTRGMQLPCPAIADLDDDGKIDILVGGCDAECNLLGWIGLKNISTNTTYTLFEKQPSWKLVDNDFRERFGIPLYAPIQRTDPFLVDLDNDGDYDVIVGCGDGNHGYLFAGKNTGTKNDPYFVRENSWEPEISGGCNSYCPSLCDLDGDSDYDLIVALSGGKTVCIYENIGSISSPIWQRNTAWEDNMNYYIYPGRLSPVDIDNDGDYDFAILSGPYCLRNVGDHHSQGTFTSSVMSISASYPILRVLQKKVVPNDTSLDIFIRTGNTASPDISWSDWRRIYNNDQISSSFRYLQYRAILSTSAPEKTPILYELKFIGVTSSLSYAVMPSFGAVGDIVTVKGSGFSPNKMINIDFGNIQTKTILSSNGSFSLIFLITPQPPLTILIKAQDEEENLATQTFTFSHKTIYVDGNYKGIEGGGKKNPFSQIQSAINMAISGYRIEVAPYLYKERIRIEEKEIDIVGIGLPTIMGSLTVVYFSHTGSSSISGFRITGAKPFLPEYPYSTGPGIYSRDASPLISNNIITGNSEGIEMNMLEFKDFIVPKIINNTIVDNTRYGIICSDLSRPLILNNIIANNGTTSPKYYAIYNDDLMGGHPGSPTADYNLIYNNGRYGTGTYYNCSGGEKTIFLDPGLTEDYHLTPQSPCIDRGTTTIYLLDKDVEGNRRIVNKIPDIGAYEYQGNTCPPNIILHKSSDKGFVAKGGTITYTITYTNEGESTATDVTIIEVLPEGVKLSSVISHQSSVNYWVEGKWQETISSSATKIKWVIPKVAPGEVGTVSFTVEVK